MEVVINRCWGGFSLSDKAVERCIELGMTVTAYNKAGNIIDRNADFVDTWNDSHGYRNRFRGSGFTRYIEIFSKNTNDLRAHPIIVKTVKELGKESWGPCASLKVIEIPFDGIDGWEIDEYDGMERVVPVHESWC